MRLSLLLLVVLALGCAACDSSEAPPVTPPVAPPVPGASLQCGAVPERTDSLRVVAGSSARIDLDSLFSDGSRTLTYAAGPGSPSWIRVDGRAVSLQASQVGVVHGVVEASRACTDSQGQSRVSVVGRLSVVVGARAPGTTCDGTPATRPAADIRIAAGGQSVLVPLFGAGGLLDEAFAAGAVRFQVEPDVATAGREGASVRLTPGVRPGTATLRVDALDPCLRAATATVPIASIASPTCSRDYDPADVDYLPLAVGRRWRYGIATSSGGIGSPPQSATGEERWEVVTAGACRGGERVYGVQVERTGIGTSGTVSLTVRGDTVVVSHPQFSDRLRSRYPASTPSVVSSTSAGQPSFGNAYGWTLLRGVGFERLSTNARQGAGFSSNWGAVLLAE